MIPAKLPSITSPYEKNVPVEYIEVSYCENIHFRFNNLTSIWKEVLGQKGDK